MNTVDNALVWLHVHATALFAYIAGVIANRPEPAGQVVIRTLATVVVIWVAIKIVKKVK